MRNPEHFHQRSGSYHDPRCRLADFRQQVNVILRRIHGLGVDHFGSDEIERLFKDDTRADLAVMKLAARYKLVEQSKRSREFGRPEKGVV